MAGWGSVDAAGAAGLVARLRSVVGRRHVLTGTRRTERYCRGFRSGQGVALAVVLPGTLVQQWQVLQACVDAGAAIIMQAANTGLTEGSTPSGSNYDRPVVVINTMRMTRIDLLDCGRQVVCLPGATLFRLEDLLRPLGRQPHSVIGSSCIGASIVGGICNNSGGSLIHRGPAYTEMALYAQVGRDGALRLVNDLGIELGRTPEEVLGRLDRGEYSPDDVSFGPAGSDQDYATRIRDTDAPTAARFNADTRRLRGASGSAGKLAVFAVRVDTFQTETPEAVFYIGTDRPEVLAQLRQAVLTTFRTIPVAAEYLHRDAFDIARVYGKDTFIFIDKFGTKFMPQFFALKGRVDAILRRLRIVPAGFSDRVLQFLAAHWPEVLPPRMLAFRDRFAHHLLLKMSGAGVQEARDFLNRFFDGGERGDWFLCDADEGRKASLHRFATAGAAIRYATVHADRVGEVMALDIALPRNEMSWQETLPKALDDLCVAKLYYGHFFCHVFHQDYLVRPGVEAAAFKAHLLDLLDKRGAQYPAEHNFGHLYNAPPQVTDFYRQLDPTNTFNPGIGKMSKAQDYDTAALGRPSDGPACCPHGAGQSDLRPGHSQGEFG